MMVLWLSIGFLAGYTFILLYAVSRLVETSAKVTGVIKIVPLDCATKTETPILPVTHAQTQIDLDRIDC